MIDASSLRQRATRIDRSNDRRVVVLAAGVATAFLFAALVAVLLPEAVRRGAWLSLHLALAGGATTAIAGVMPFFVAAFAAVPPADGRLRVAAVLAVALGSSAVAIGVTDASTLLAAIGGIGFIAGVALTALAALRPLRSALGPSRGIVVQGYVVALAEVGVGATLATLYVGRWQPIVEAWGSVKPAHAWLNLVGFVSLVVATTLLHFFPTVIGARIAARPSARITVAGLAGGPLLVAIGFALELDLVGRVGSLLTIAGAVALAAYARSTWRTRGQWRTDASWHRFAMGGLISAIAWFEAGIAIGAGRVLLMGTTPAAWSIETVVGPLVAGWVGLAILASATHLLPAVGPGDQTAHARQRSTLGHWSIARLIVANTGVAGLAVGLPMHLDLLAGTGVALSAVALVTTASLLIAAASVPPRSHSRGPE